MLAQNDPKTKPPEVVRAQGPAIDADARGGSHGWGNPDTFLTQYGR